MPEDTSRQAHPRLRKLPLVLTVCQVQFPAILRIADSDFIAPFQEALRFDYPNTVQEQQLQLVVGPQGLQPAPLARQWRLSDANGDFSVVLAAGSVALENRGSAYASIRVFSERLRVVLDRLLATLRPAAATRIGLRYINEIRHPQVSAAAGWRGLISPTLLGPIGSQLADDYRVEQAVQELRLSRDALGVVTLRHGHLPRGSTVAPGPEETPRSEPFYLIDIDHGDTSNRDNFDPAEIHTKVLEFNESNWSIFRSSCTDDLFGYFEPA